MLKRRHLWSLLPAVCFVDFVCPCYTALLKLLNATQRCSNFSTLHSAAQTSQRYTVLLKLLKYHVCVLFVTLFVKSERHEDISCLFPYAGWKYCSPIIFVLVSQSGCFSITVPPTAKLRLRRVQTVARRPNVQLGQHWYRHRETPRFHPRVTVLFVIFPDSLSRI